MSFYFFQTPATSFWNTLLPTSPCLLFSRRAICRITNPVLLRTGWHGLEAPRACVCALGSGTEGLVETGFWIKSLWKKEHIRWGTIIVERRGGSIHTYYSFVVIPEMNPRAQPDLLGYRLGPFLRVCNTPWYFCTILLVMDAQLNT